METSVEKGVNIIFEVFFYKRVQLCCNTYSKINKKSGQKPAKRRQPT